MSFLQKQMTGLDKRMDDEKQLAAVYGRWADLVAAQKLAALHEILFGVLWILLALLIVLSIGGWLERLGAKLAADRRRLLTLRTVIRVAVEAVGVVVILLLLFGPPAQLATVLGLAGAGLTVALKDFIVGFFGWFVLMGKNGMRVGDWVEINGVGGEVVEIGLFHTVLLETGNWTDMGHPTGRSVTFVNGFAIEGHYFNFSTSGQWLWDELRLSVPLAEDPAPIVDAIQKLISDETSADARLAEQEWQRVASTRGMSAFSATPSVSVRPGGAGVEILVRYITRASERHQVRSRLYRAVVELMRRKNLPAPEPASS
jgi:small-conductance mechanosensitive channel